MNSAPSPKPLEGPDALRFGEWRLDRRSGELWRGDQAVRLQEQPFRVLELLLLRAGQVVTREELIAHVWPPGVIVDFDTGVNTAIRKLRAVLDDHADNPRYIQTLPRRGYRLLVPAEPVTDPTPAFVAGPVEAPAPPVPPQPAQSARKPLGPGVKLAAAAVAVVALVAGVLRGRLSAPPVVPADAVEPAGPADLPRNAVAVLPFRALGGSSREHTLAEGVAESLLHQLSLSPELVVIARASSFAVGDEPPDSRAVGRSLGARYLVGGTLQSIDDQLHLTTRLVDAADGRTLWSFRFERRLADIIKVQDEIAAQVARVLRVGLAHPGGIAAEDQGTSNVDAYLAYLEGRRLTSTRRVADLHEAVRLLTRATQEDPQFAAAFAQLARAEELLMTYDPPFDADGKRRRLAEAEEHARRALALAPNSALAHVVMGTLVSDPESALNYMRRGVALNRNLALAWAHLAEIYVGRSMPGEEAEQALEKAVQLDPLEPRVHYLKALYALESRGDPAQAREALMRTLQVDPEYYGAHARLAQLEMCCGGDLSRAIRHAEQALKLDPRAHWVRRMLVGLYLDAGESVAAAQVATESGGRDDPSNALLLELYRGEVEAARRRVLDRRFHESLL